MRNQRLTDYATPSVWSKRRGDAGRGPDDLDRHFEETARDGTATAGPWATAGNPLPLLDALSQEARLHSKLHKRIAEWASQLTADPTLRDTNYRDVEDALNHACAVERADAAATALSVAAHHAESLANSLQSAQDYVANLYHDGADHRQSRQTRSA